MRSDTNRRVPANGHRGRVRISRGLTGAALLALALTACKGPELVDKNVVRAIKWTELERGVAVQERRIAGIVKPVKVTELSFEVAGRVEVLHVAMGDKVKAGDILAELDREPFQLHVRHAEAELAAAKAIHKEEAENLHRQQTLYDDGWIAKARLDTAIAGHEAARSQTRARGAALDLKRRDLKHAVLRAPFDGVISKKSIEAFEEIAAGQPIFELNGEGEFKVTLRVPPTLIDRIRQGERVTVRFPSQPDLTLTGVVTEIGARAEEANAFPVTVLLQEHSELIRAGLSAEVVFDFSSQTADSGGVMVPMTAILSGQGQSYYVFRYDRDSATITRTAVKVQNIHDNEVQIAGALQSGDIIATAGVEFLTDGQQVRLMAEQMPYGAGVEQ